MKKLKASKNPVRDIERVSYAGQSPDLKIYEPGFEPYFETIPKKLSSKKRIHSALNALNFMSLDLSGSANAVHIIRRNVEAGGFKRSILALEKPKKVEKNR